MRPLAAADVCRAVSGTFLQAGGDTVTGVTSDSRRIAPGDLFIPLVGARFDGHDYMNAALSDGAAGCLCSRVPEALLPGKFYIQVQDTTLALGALAAWYRGLYDIPVVQVTGSAGKTTTKEMLASVLSRHFCTLKTRANLNNHIGTPQTLLELDPRHQAAVIETGLDHFGQIRYMGSLVQPTIAVITNIGDAHIENLGGTRQGILQAKCEIFDHLRPGGLAVLCGDDPLLNGLTLPFETLRCGKGESCNVRVTDIVRRGIDGLDCTVTTSRRSYRLSIPSPGDYMIYPASMAAAIGEYLGLSEQEIVEGVAAYVSTGSRMRRIRLPEDRLIIDDCYNANPQAMEAALEILADTACRRRVAVLGDMGELGPISHDAHLEVGRVTARLGLDAVIAIGPKSAAIAETAGPRALHFDTVQQALPALREQLTPGTAMLVKASHAMEFGKIVNELETTTYDRHQCDRSGQIL